MPILSSHTLVKLRRLLRVLPRRRFNAFCFGVLPLSVLSGIVDLATVAVAGRLAGSLVGNDLKDSLPGVEVFDPTLVGQSIKLVIILVVLSWAGSIFKLSRLVFVQRLTSQVWRDISNQIVKKVIGQPYDYFLETKSSSISSLLVVNIQKITYRVIYPIMLIISSSIVMLAIAIALSISLGVKALILITLLGLCFFIISSFVVPYLRHAQKQRIRLDALATSILNQIFYSIRDIHLTQTSKYFESRFVSAGETARRFQWKSDLLPDLPKLLIEPLFITLVFVTALLPIYLNPEITDYGSKIIPFIATFVVAAVKITPPLQDLFRSLTTIRGSLPGIDSALAYLELPEPTRGFIPKGSLSPEGIFPRREISLHNIGYKYPGSEQSALRSVSMNVPVGSRIALMGPTGSGKSTLSNLLLGHLEPITGQIRLDGIPLESSDLLSWQRCCSEVPQNINLLDASILQNIAFGCSEDDLNLDDVWEAVEASQLYDVVTEMPHGLYTYIGENGIYLSGGQRQRLALARLFYRKTKFLLLDEATSSLDEKTESNVINSLDIVGRRCTVVVIAHRLNTLAKCDYIYEINSGMLVSSGTYNDLCDTTHPLGNTVKV